MAPVTCSAANARSAAGSEAGAALTLTSARGGGVRPLLAGAAAGGELIGASGRAQPAESASNTNAWTACFIVRSAHTVARFASGSRRLARAGARACRAEPRTGWPAKDGDSADFKRHGLRRQRSKVNEPRAETRHVLSLLVAILLGIVEGLTEYLPVSSTGHLILVSQILGETSEGAKAFDIVIQLGAILAVVVHYRRLLGARLAGLLRGEIASLRLATALAVAFAPAAAVGFVLQKTIKAHLFGPMPVAIALFVGGVLMIVVERVRAKKHIQGLVGLEHVTPGRALVIGLGQCFSLWPGSSRSMCTIVAGQATGLSTATSAEFSFLLALPTLGAATLYEGFKARHELGSSSVGGVQVAVGLVVSFFVAWGVISVFIKYLQRRGLEPFGFYRIALSAVVLWLALKG
jgi:undecaprenyl-diphosphatase